MALQQTPSGLEIQDIAEIKGELEDAYRALFTIDIKVDPASTFGKEIGIWAEREALVQQKMQFIQQGFSREDAQGSSLDALAAMFGAARRGATQSKSSAGRCTGVDTTIILNGSTVIQQNDALDVWTVVEGTDGISPFGYEIGTVTTGEVTGVVIEANETGEKRFVTASAFAIGSPIAGWTGVNVTRDIETFETGQLVESDGEFRDRSRDELFAGGNDTSGIKAVITKVPGVTEVQVYENRDCTNVSPDGISPGHIEAVVTGGDDLAVATAILTRIPPGTGMDGTTLVQLADTEGNVIDIRFTRPAMIEIWIDIQIFNFSAEGTLPTNFADVVGQAVLDFGNANSRVSQDVLYQQFIAPTQTAIQDSFTGKFAYDTLVSAVGTTSSTFLTNIPISIRERADYDSARITVVVA